MIISIISFIISVIVNTSFIINITITVITCSISNISVIVSIINFFVNIIIIRRFILYLANTFDGLLVTYFACRGGPSSFACFKRSNVWGGEKIMIWESKGWRLWDETRLAKVAKVCKGINSLESAPLLLWSAIGFAFCFSFDCGLLFCDRKLQGFTTYPLKIN